MKLKPEDAKHNGEREDIERAQIVLGMFSAHTNDAIEKLDEEVRRGSGADPVDKANGIASAARKLARVAASMAKAQRFYWGN